MDIKVPEVGESVYEALLAKWYKKNGEAVAKDEPLCELETDKITLDLHADTAGILTITVAEGTTVKIGAVIGSIAEQAAVAPAPREQAASVDERARLHEEIKASVSSPSVRREMLREGIAPETVNGSGRGGRITLDDLFSRIQESSRRPEKQGAVVPAPEPPAQAPPESAAATPAPTAVPGEEKKAPAIEPAPPHTEPLPVGSEVPPVHGSRREERVAMTPIRKRIAERLVAARQQTAMLTTFTEADLSHVKMLREKYREHFRQRHGSTLGLMPFFIRACVEALKEFPALNARIDGNDIVYHHYYDIGIAIGGEKGLVVPILRNVERMRMYEMDQAIADFTEKVRNNRLAIADLEGGTFSISNGGVYGSMLSTPILNPPQSGVLGMHAILDRPVVRDGQVVIRPMMYLALSYDHRIVDGRQAVGFLKRVKEYIEEPEELLLES
ncbi:2-oxoglutarate dehydrogenase complex dihydrolipoyllysine-residue succinyltransferase [Geobacter sp. SVR]|uniref:2-oxoglutarate dehydrogenase complex dihydrolipoyllysine-residue succinyltransferase n=1 Tax=Geobacter sp. SVR TaxID=2495594 RepID=UPI00143F0323|nr:2-oxoglutarate dehydrogenase complex dihydrolipoyllysine-residue succinyltransferase [Geobacter sp. SVR]BCS54267.1 dihydrolipoyllysine-residue succinyltransferase component of 2-oxoglutarate dehydrogenase complex [Geobacter sp. SVR]GCF85874.1 dihydrolipoyllysine-residue succinyltransferase component of 2-oxoglutarate dehydrogenase complex [Geobacter sp. SVR]